MTRCAGPLAAVLAATCVAMPAGGHPVTSAGDSTVWRHRGLGEAGYPGATGVRRFHGLGDGNTAPPTIYYVTPYGMGALYGGGYSPQWRPMDWRPAPTPPPPPPAVYWWETAPRAAPPASPADAADPAEAAWDLIGRGDARTARRRFAVLALRSAQDAGARAGFGVAAAMLGREHDAAWSLRRAMVTDAASLRELPIGGAAEAAIRALLDRDQAGEGSGDTLFMRAALPFLAGEADAARASITQAVAAGDLDPGTLALRDLLGAAP